MLDRVCRPTHGRAGFECLYSIAEQRRHLDEKVQAFSSGSAGHNASSRLQIRSDGRHCSERAVAPASYLEAHLSVEVPSCTEGETDFESSTLLELKSRVPVVFPKATYQSCKNVNMKSRAHVQHPGACRKSEPRAPVMTFVSGWLRIATTAIWSQVGACFSLMGTVSSRGGHYDLGPQIRIGLTNDGDVPVNLIATSLYLNDTPMHFEKFVVHPARYAELRLSNAAVDAVLAGKSVLIFIRE